MEPQDQRDLKVTMAIPDFQDDPDKLEDQVNRVKMGHQGHSDPQVKTETQDQEEHQDHQENLETQDQKV